jgi:hypothetical protein
MRATIFFGIIIAVVLITVIFISILSLCGKEDARSTAPGTCACPSPFHQQCTSDAECQDWASTCSATSPLSWRCHPTAPIPYCVYGAAVVADQCATDADCGKNGACRTAETGAGIYKACFAACDGDNQCIANNNFYSQCTAGACCPPSYTLAQCGGLATL